VQLSGDGRRVLLPMQIAEIQKGRKRLLVDAILAAQFANVPVLANPEQVTRDEEERISAYYGAGRLYATPSRTGPWL
jgi:photosynthetic reaction center H subunit